MPYPTLEQYNQAFQAHSRLLTDPQLRAGSVASTSLGLPLAISGGFALTYTITTSGGKFAVRCFHREARGLEARYAAISKRLSALRSPHFLDFAFQADGIRVDGKPYPIVKMEWARGVTLGEFLESNHGNGAALAKLSASLERLNAFLEAESLSHGDIQTGNLIVADGGGTVQLIDYDGMYVDGIGNLGSAEFGHINFQHPERLTANPFGPGLDRFSFIALSVALKALRADASLWRATGSEAEAILFRANDYADPESSLAFAALASRPALAQDARNLASVCKAPIGVTPSLPDFLAGRGIPAAQITLSPTPARRATAAAYASQWPIAAAADYAACLRLVGQRAEVVGKIVEVSSKWARNKRPYLFINFGDWRGRIFKIAIWSDGLNALSVVPDKSWAGSWVSVVGLMQPPYLGSGQRGKASWSYEHLAINVEANGQLTRISEAEAKRRLAAKPAGLNREIVEGMRAGGASRPAPRPSPSPPPTPRAPSPAAPPPTPNEAIVIALRGPNRPAPGSSPRAAPPRMPPPGRQVPHPPGTSSGGGGSFWWAVAAAALIGGLMLLGATSEPSPATSVLPPPPASAPAASAAPVAQRPQATAETSLEEELPSLRHRGPHTPAQARWCAATSIRIATWAAAARLEEEREVNAWGKLRADHASRCRALAKDGRALKRAETEVEPQRSAIEADAEAAWREVVQISPAPAAARAPRPTPAPAAVVPPPNATPSAEHIPAFPAAPPPSDDPLPVQPPGLGVEPPRRGQPSEPVRQPLSLPTNAEVDRFLGGWKCKRGYALSGAECVQIHIPANAQLNYSNDGWVCKRGFSLAGAECAPVRMPENAQLDFTGHAWTCKRGFAPTGDGCAPVQMPANARLDYTGRSWVCARGYRLAGSACEPVEIPANARLDYTGNGWACERGFRQVGARCEPN
jgi:hypothetical protein